MKLLIKNGKIIQADSDQKLDILCENGVISQLQTRLPEQEADQVIDAKGCYVFPGGIDPHVHMHLPSKAGFSSDDFYHGSKAALFGGTTTLIDFVTPFKGQSLIDALKERKDDAADALTDYSFHLSPVEWRDTTAAEIKTCIEQEGISSFKIYMAYKKAIGLEDDIIQKVLKTVGKYGGLVTAHCELGDEIEKLRENLIATGKTAPEFHPLSRPSDLEAKAVDNFIKMGKKAGCPVYIVHVSTAQSIPFIAQAQEEGQAVFAETCPQYLLLDDSKYQGSFSEAAPYVMSPPLRKKEDNRGLWKALEKGIIQTVGTDHCPFSIAQKKSGVKDFRKIPNGAGGVEHRMALLYTYGVLQNKISLQDFVALTSTNAAKIFGLYPKKGVIQVGSDADLVVWNPNIESIISAKTHHSLADTNIFEGIPVKGAPDYVITRGKIRIKHQKLQDDTPASFLWRPIER